MDTDFPNVVCCLRFKRFCSALGCFLSYWCGCVPIRSSTSRVVFTSNASPSAPAPSSPIPFSGPAVDLVLVFVSFLSGLFEYETNSPIPALSELYLCGVLCSVHALLLDRPCSLSFLESMEGLLNYCLILTDALDAHILSPARVVLC